MIQDTIMTALSLGPLQCDTGETRKMAINAVLPLEAANPGSRSPFLITRLAPGIHDVRTQRNLAKSEDSRPSYCDLTTVNIDARLLS